MSTEKAEKNTGTRHKAREGALQMLFAADMAQYDAAFVTGTYWVDLGDASVDDKTRDFANGLVRGTIEKLAAIDERIKTRAEHWRIERMAFVDRNVLRLAVYEFLFSDTPNPVVINEALEIARRFSTYEATQFINGILDAIRLDIEGTDEEPAAEQSARSTSPSSAT